MLYEKNRNLLKLCALCNNRIHSNYVVCQEHLADLELYKDDFWFQELCRFQQRQYEIEVEEIRLVKGDRYTLFAPLQKSSKTRGKQLTNQQKQDILYLYKKGFGDRKIAKQLNLRYSSVNKFLYRYRKYSRNARQLQG